MSHPEFFHSNGFYDSGSYIEYILKKLKDLLNLMEVIRTKRSGLGSKDAE